MKLSKRYLALSILVVIVFLLKFQFMDIESGEIGEFRGGTLSEDVWYPLVADDVNSKGLKVVIDNKEYTSDKYLFYMDNNIYKRLAKIETITNLQKSNLMETLQAAYKSACEEKDEAQASEYARAIRNSLLEQSDKEMVLDRFKVDTSSTINFIASIKQIFENNWISYRQQLRNLPEQEGFPFNAIFPELPRK